MWSAHSDKLSLRPGREAEQSPDNRGSAPRASRVSPSRPGEEQGTKSCSTQPRKAAAWMLMVSVIPTTPHSSMGGGSTPEPRAEWQAARPIKSGQQGQSTTGPALSGEISPPNPHPPTNGCNLSFCPCVGKFSVETKGDSFQE